MPSDTDLFLPDSNIFSSFWIQGRLLCRRLCTLMRSDRLAISTVLAECLDSSTSLRSWPAHMRTFMGGDSVLVGGKKRCTFRNPILTLWMHSVQIAAYWTRWQCIPENAKVIPGNRLLKTRVLPEDWICRTKLTTFTDLSSSLSWVKALTHTRQSPFRRKFVRESPQETCLVYSQTSFLCRCDYPLYAWEFPHEKSATQPVGLWALKGLKDSFEGFLLLPVIRSHGRPSLFISSATYNRDLGIIPCSKPVTHSLE